MKIKDLKKILCVSGEQKVLIRSESGFNDNVVFNSWEEFVNDLTIDELFLDDSSCCFVVGNYVVNIWVL